MSATLGSSFRILVTAASVATTTDASGETITIENLGWTGSGATNGWRYVSLGTPFDDGAARFAEGSRIVSPRWRDFDILGIEVKLRCSTNAPSRWLKVCFLRDAKEFAGPSQFAAVLRADRAETQRLPVWRESHANGIALSLSGSDGGDWGVYEIGVAVATARTAAGFAVLIR